MISIDDALAYYRQRTGETFDLDIVHEFPEEFNTIYYNGDSLPAFDDWIHLQECFEQKIDYETFCEVRASVRIPLFDILQTPQNYRKCYENIEKILIKNREKEWIER